MTQTEAFNMVRGLGRAALTKGLIKKHDSTELFIGLAVYRKLGMKGHDSGLDQAYETVKDVVVEEIANEIGF